MQLDKHRANDIVRPENESYYYFYFFFSEIFKMNRYSFFNVEICEPKEKRDPIFST